MGYYKNRMIEEQELGINFVDGKFVCPDCFEDYSIKSFILTELCWNSCDYCGNKSNIPIAACLNDVLRFMAEGINKRWEDPANSVAYCSAEGGYQGAEIIDTPDMIDYELQLNLDNNLLRNDLITALGPTNCWCKKDPYGLWPHEQDLSEWQDFSKQVMYHSRYVFYKIKAKNEHSLAVYQQPYEILDHIGNIVNELNLVELIDINTIFFRARLLKNKNHIIKTAKEIGTTPKANALNANRMSPTGIPMFYGAFDQDTALTEIFHNYSPSKPHHKIAHEGRTNFTYIAIGKFKTQKSLHILNFTKLPLLPSFFDLHNLHLYEKIKFIKEFVDDLKKPILIDNRDHIDYVPTQVVTEYFRHVYKYNKINIDGIIYPSSCYAGGICIVLFVDNKNCVDEGEEGILALEKSSLIKIKINKIKGKINYNYRITRKLN